MSRLQLIADGMELIKIVDLLELSSKYDEWKEEVLSYAESDEQSERLKIFLHVMDTPYGTKEEKIDQYRSCIMKTIKYLQKDRVDQPKKIDALETMIENFGLYLKNMFLTVPENKATLKKEVLKQIRINNEYDVQHMMYAMVKALYPSARREVNQDTGYGTVRYDIVIEEIDTVIEIKCTRKDHSESKLYRELGEDGYFYKCSRLIMYVYDKQQVIRDVGNFIKSLERTREESGKDIKVYVEQEKNLI